MNKKIWILWIVCGITVLISIAYWTARNTSNSKQAVASNASAAVLPKKTEAKSKPSETVVQPTPSSTVQSTNSAASLEASNQGTQDASAAPSSEKNKKKDPFSQIMALSRKLMDNPAMRTQMQEEMKIEVAKQYQDLFKEWNLDDKTKAAVEEILIDKMLMSDDMGMLMTDEKISAQDLSKVQEKAYKEVNEDLAKYLSLSQVERMQSYEKELLDHSIKSEVNDKLAALNLDPQFREKVTGIILEETKGQTEVKVTIGNNNLASSSNSMLTEEQIREGRKMLQGGKLSSALQDETAKQKEINQRILTRVQPLLNTEQYEKLKTQQEGEIQEMQTVLEIIKVLQGGNAQSQ